MTTFAPPEKRAVQTPATAQRTEASADTALAGILNSGSRVQTQMKLRQALNGSPRVAAQAGLAQRLATGAGGAPVQRVEDEEPLQGKMKAPVQRVEDEEPLQGKMKAPVQRVEDEEPLQGKMKAPVQRVEDEEPLQGKMKAPVQTAENRTGLPDQLKSGIEALSGQSLDDVRVHTNSPQPAQLEALAFTQGTDIHVAPGQESTLPHEAWHAVQQKQGRVKPTTQMAGVGVNTDHGLEAEADAMGQRALRG